MYGWAWEFLRRNPAFRDAAYLNRNQDAKRRRNNIVYCPQADGSKWFVSRDRVPQAEQWGLHFFPHPDRDGSQVTPFWTPELTKGELETFVEPARTAKCDLISLADVPGKKTVLVRYGERAHLIVEGRGFGEILGSTAPACSPRHDVEVAFAFGNLGELVDNVERVGAFVRYCSEPKSRTPWLQERTVRRLTDALIALDGRRAYHSYREIAHAFHEPDHIADDWLGSGSIKLKMRRLVGRGEALMNGCYRKLVSARSY